MAEEDRQRAAPPPDAAETSYTLKNGPKRTSLSAAVLQDLQLMVRNLLLWVLQFEEQPPNTRYVLSATHNYLMPLRYTVQKMYILFLQCDRENGIRPEFKDMADKTIAHGRVTDLIFLFLTLVNCSSACVEYLRFYSPDVSEGFFAYFLTTLQAEFLKFNAHSLPNGQRTTDVEAMAYRSPEELVYTIVQTNWGYGGSGSHARSNTRPKR